MGVPVQMWAGDDEAEADRPMELATQDWDAQAWDARFAEMAERQAGFMFRVAHGLLRNVQDAEDAVQETLLKLYRSDGWRAMEDEKAFLARTVWRVGLDIAARRPRHSDSMEGLEDAAGREFAAGGDSAEQCLVEHGERAVLRRLIDALPEELRQPLVLSAIEEMTSREVGLAMGIPEGTVRTRVMRARAELKRRFEGLRASSAGREGTRKKTADDPK